MSGQLGKSYLCLNVLSRLNNLISQWAYCEMSFPIPYSSYCLIYNMYINMFSLLQIGYQPVYLKKYLIICEIVVSNDLVFFSEWRFNFEYFQPRFHGMLPEHSAYLVSLWLLVLGIHLLHSICKTMARNTQSRILQQTQPIQSGRISINK